MNRPAQSLPELTHKQRDVLALVADNRTSKEIAARLGISESAVNQRIEMVRSRLGGLPRGELARLYRQEFALPDDNEPIFEETWQKIHLPDSPTWRNGAGTEGIISPRPAQLAAADAERGDGSQLSGFFFDQDEGWLGRHSGAATLVQRAAIVAIVAIALVIAVGVTQLLGPIGGS